MNTYNGISNLFDSFAGAQRIDSRLHNELFDFFFAYRLFRTGRTLLFLCGAFVIIVCLSRERGATLAVHLLATDAAIEFPFEKKLRIAAVRAQLVFCQHCLHRVEQFGRNDRRKGVCIFLSVMRVKTDIAGIAQDLIDRIGQKRFSSVR